MIDEHASRMQPGPRSPRRRHLSTALALFGILAVALGGIILILTYRMPIPTLTITIPGTITAPTSDSLIPRITFSADHATVHSVEVVSAAGPVAGRWNPSSWTPNHRLAWSTEYGIRVTAIDRAGGRPLVKTTYFTTSASPVSLGTVVYPGNGRRVGMGATWVVKFKQPLSPAEQSAVLQRLQTSATIPETIGWHWWSASEVDGRPRKFWPVNDTATLRLNLDGMKLGGHPVIDSNRTVSFTVNEDHEIKISAKTHRMLVYNNNRLIKNFPISLGKPGFPTLSGTLVVLYKRPVVFMNSATIGHPGLYALNVYQNVAISTDGYFLHSAPWDIKDHGHRNVSFGCVEQNPPNAAWIYQWSEPGDVVIIKGTSYRASEADGEGDWNIPWSRFTITAESTAPSGPLPPIFHLTPQTSHG